MHSDHSNSVVSVSVDVGGTFTDFVVLDIDGNLNSFKMLSTPSRPEDAIVGGLEKVQEPIEDILHATTIATNALMGQVGLELPSVGLFVTKGFRDVVEIARQNRSSLYDLFFEKPRELVPRSMRFEIDERVDFSGLLLKSVDPGEVKKIASRMPEIQSVAVCFLHSYANNANEKAAEKILRMHFKYLSASYQVAPEPREYERTSTVLLNAVLMPIVARYIQSLERELSKFGKPALFIMASSGGLIDSTEAGGRPVQMIESGPAAGVIASSEFGRLLNLPNLISFDMGGTTAKAGTVANYQPEIVPEYEVGGRAHHGRILKGSGYPVKFPFLDLAEVSAGGGTIIWRDAARALHVGPLSAGAEPGPISYRRGGNQPTLTDANLVLGRLSPRLLGGGLSLDTKAAKSGFSKLGEFVEVAGSAIKLANLEMARAIRLVTVERGLDPSEFNLMVFGGAGPQHAAEVADELGVPKVIIPPEPGAFSALGMLLADSKFEIRSSFPKDVEDSFRSLERKLATQAKAGTYFTRFADVRYADQGWEVLVPVSKPAVMSNIAKSFEEKHRALYGFNLDKPVEVVTIRVFAVTPRLKARFTAPAKQGDAEPKDSARVYFGEWVETPVYLRQDLPANFRAKGPMRIEEYGSCILVPPAWRVSMGGLGALVMER